MNRVSLKAGAIAASLFASMFASTAALAQPAPFAQDPFPDVPASHANFDAIEYLRKNNVLRGYQQDGTYKPDRRMTRAEFIKLVTNPFLMDVERLNDCIKETDPPETKIFFTDVRKDDWFAPEVCHAKITELIDGYPDGTFKPNHYINFAEAAKILSNAFALQTETDPSNQRWYQPFVRKLGELRAIPTTIERMDHEITRGEMAEMVYRIHADV